MPSAKKKKQKRKAKVSYRKYFVHYLYCLAIIILLTITGINIDKYLNQEKVLGTSVDTTPLQNEKKYWENILKDTPTYIDGYLQIAKVEVELGNKNEALNMIQKALILDPNSIRITEVQKNLGL